MITLKRGKMSPVFRPKRLTTFVALLIIAAGIVSGLFAAYTNQTNKSQYLVGRAQTIADSISGDAIKDLKGNVRDLKDPAYIKTQRQLQQIQGNSADITDIQIFTVSNNKVSVSMGGRSSNGSLSPGSEVSNPSNELRSTLLEGKRSFDSLVSDYPDRQVAGYAPATDQEGHVVGAVGVFTDANTYYLETALYALVPLLLAAIPFAGILRDIKLQAKEHEIMYLKNQFISIASHELRSPLSGMLWGITALQAHDKKLPMEQQKILQNMFQSTEASLATVNEILDSSIFERGQMKQLQKEQLDMRAIFGQVVATLELGAKEKDLHIAYQDAWKTPQYVEGDVEALKRATMNIIANAIKYSHTGQDITLGHRIDNKTEHVFSIKDHGIGIPPKEQEKVLDGYYRASNASELHTTGTGLGLWTSRLTIEQHGGRLWINSLEGRGTTVYIALPVSNIKQEAAEEFAQEAPRDRLSSRNSS